MRLLLPGIIPIFLLAGCTSNLKELEKISPKAEDFPSSLAAEYLGYSQSEAELGHSSSAEHFATKGMQAATGKVPPLDEVDTGIKNAQLLTASRSALTSILKNSLTDTAPQESARAQLLFDCWNHQEKDSMPTSTAPCAEEFKQVYIELKEFSDNLVHGKEGNTTINFIEGSAELDDEEKEEIKAIVKHISGHNPDRLELKSFPGKDKKLADERLAAVRAELIAQGVKKNRIVKAKNTIAETSGKAVLLSNDAEVVDTDKIEITITSSPALPAGIP